jgi:hypothetical protein
MPNIKIGDLVIVVSQPCKCTYHIGKIFKVDTLEVAGLWCSKCKWSSKEIQINCAGSYAELILPINCLKKIDPLPEDETIDEDLEVSA